MVLFALKKQDALVMSLTLTLSCVPWLRSTATGPHWAGASDTATHKVAS